MQNDVLLKVDNLRMFFPMGRGFLKKNIPYVRALDGVSFQVHKGETFAVVGESGCGKTTLGRCIIRLEKPNSGRIIFDGQDLISTNRKTWRRCLKDLQIIFQDPYSSLNRRMTVGRIIGEGLVIHSQMSPSQRREQVAEIMKVVGLRPEYISRYPHEFSGGQRQRIGIARALVLNPKLIIADEPVSALDVSIQAQILNLMVELQKRFDLTYLFISHDLSVVRHFCDRVAVMYLGRFVELANKVEIYEHPRHPYSRALISAAPVANPTRKAKRIILPGDVPSPIQAPPGCPFHPRCDYRQTICQTEVPIWQEIENNHWVACHFPLG